MSSAVTPRASLPLNEPVVPAPGRLLHQAVTMLAGFAGIGAGTVSLGIGSTLLSTAPTPWTIIGASVSVLWGLALLVWAVQGLRHGSPVWRRIVLPVAPAGVVLHLAAVAAGIWGPGLASRSLDGAALSAAGLELMILGSTGWLARHPTPGAKPEPERTAPGPLLAGMFAAALLVAAVTTPGLAATAAGHHAVPHGQHTDTRLSPPSGHH